MVYKNLVDIHTCKQRENASRVDNAVFLLKQLGNHKLFKVGDNIVEVDFAETNKTFSDALISHFRRRENGKT